MCVKGSRVMDALQRTRHGQPLPGAARGWGRGAQGGTRQTAAGAGGGGAGRLPKPHRAGVAGGQEAPQCAAVPERRRAAAGRSPGTEKIGRLSRRHHRDSLMVSSLLAPPPFILS